MPRRRFSRSKSRRRNTGDWFPIERIIEARSTGSGIEYKVRWVGYGPGEDSWVREEDVTAESIKLFRDGEDPKVEVSIETSGTETENDKGDDISEEVVKVRNNTNAFRHICYVLPWIAVLTFVIYYFVEISLILSLL